MIAEVYQELKKNGSQAALWKKLTGATTPGHSKPCALLLNCLSLVWFVLSSLHVWWSKVVRGAMTLKLHSS